MAIVAAQFKPENKVDSSDPSEIAAALYAQLANAVADRKAALRTPSLATLGLDGRPRVRTVVLRSVDPHAHRIGFHTDARSDKFAEMRADSRVALHFYDAAAKTQIRIEGTSSLHVGDAVALAAWQGAGRSARRTYASEPAPGASLNAPDDAGFVADEATSFERFTVAVVRIESLDWLYLRAAGHRRLLFTRTGDLLAPRWLAP
jgi:pyridoxamine 5'-phosphate oxidase